MAKDKADSAETTPEVAPPVPPPAPIVPPAPVLQGSTTRIVDTPETPVEASPSPAARAAVARKAAERQRVNSPAKQPTKWSVGTYDKPDDLTTVEALDENEAWARYCDGMGKWPSPASRIVEPWTPPKKPEPEAK